MIPAFSTAITSLLVMAATVSGNRANNKSTPRIPARTQRFLVHILVFSFRVSQADGSWYQDDYVTEEAYTVWHPVYTPRITSHIPHQNSLQYAFYRILHMPSLGSLLALFLLSRATSFYIC